MADTWNQMTTDEKLEALRSNIRSMMGALTDLSAKQDALSARVGQIGQLANEVAKAIEKLESQQ